MRVQRHSLPRLGNDRRVDLENSDPCFRGAIFGNRSEARHAVAPRIVRHGMTVRATLVAMVVVLPRLGRPNDVTLRFNSAAPQQRLPVSAAGLDRKR